MNTRTKYLYLILGFLFLIAVLLNLMSGSINIGIGDLISYLNGNLSDEKTIVLNQIRIPKMFTALLAGMSLSVCGVIMQTLFLNPLAGPYVLGINSGANLAVALVMLSTGSVININNEFISLLSIQGAAIIGACSMLLLMLSISKKFSQQAGLLLVGVMITTNWSRTAPEKVEVNNKIECPDAMTGRKHRKKWGLKLWHEPV